MCLLTSSGCASATGSMALLQEIERREEEDPHQVDEVPIEAGVLDAVGEPLLVRVPELAAEGQEIRVDDDPAHDVQAVKAGEHKVDAVKIIVRGKVPVVELV